MFAACLTHGEQTNHCKMTMVWWENDISILLFHCRSQVARSRDRCVSVLHKAVVSGAVRVSLIGLKISGDEEDEGKRDGVEKDRRKKSSGSDID